MKLTALEGNSVLQPSPDGAQLHTQDEEISRGCSHPIVVARVIVVDHMNRVLLLRRCNTDVACRQWSLPGGKVERFERITDCAERELEEETELRPRDLEFRSFCEGFVSGPPQLHFIEFYFSCVDMGKLVLNQEEHSEFAWVGATELPEYAMAFGHDRVLRHYFRYFSTKVHKRISHRASWPSVSKIHFPKGWK